MRAVPTRGADQLLLDVAVEALEDGVGHEVRIELADLLVLGAHEVFFIVSFPVDEGDLPPWRECRQGRPLALDRP